MVASFYFCRYVYRRSDKPSMKLTIPQPSGTTHWKLGLQMDQNVEKVHSTTTWTKFYPILTFLPGPLESTFYMIKLRFCDKGIKFLRNYHLRFVLCSNCQIYGGVSQNFVAFSKYMNFIYLLSRDQAWTFY